LASDGKSLSFVKSDVLVGIVPDKVVIAPVTNAVVAIYVLLVPAAAVGAVGVPVSAGDALGANVLVVLYTVPPVTTPVFPLVIEPGVTVTSNLPALSRDKLIPLVAVSSTLFTKLTSAPASIPFNLFFNAVVKLLSVCTYEESTAKLLSLVK
jgi:hypothetical protein